MMHIYDTYYIHICTTRNVDICKMYKYIIYKKQVMSVEGTPCVVLYTVTTLH